MEWPNELILGGSFQLKYKVCVSDNNRDDLRAETCHIEYTRNLRRFENGRAKAVISGDGRKHTSWFQEWCEPPRSSAFRLW